MVTDQLQRDGGLNAASTGVVLHEAGGPDELVLEIDGPGLHPSSVDALSFLELASAYFALVAAEATRSGCTLRFAGIEIRDKCAAPPRGGADQVRRFQKAARLYDQPGHSIAAMGADWKVPISVSKETRVRPMDSLETLRAKTLRAGGHEPAVRFSSVLERDEFTLHASEDLARALAKHLYREVEIMAQLERGRDGAILAGKVLSFEPIDVSCEDPWVAWEQWHQALPHE